MDFELRLEFKFRRAGEFIAGWWCGPSEEGTPFICDSELREFLGIPSNHCHLEVVLCSKKGDFRAESVSGCLCCDNDVKLDGVKKVLDGSLNDLIQPFLPCYVTFYTWK